MASAAEQLASNFSLESFKKAETLKKRLWFTLGALIVYRLGSYIPLPGIDADVMRQLTDQHSGGILAMFNMLGGGALGRMAIFALSIFPYITASIILQLLSSIYEPLIAIKKEGETGRKKINQYTRYLTIIIACVQGYVMARGLADAKESPVTIDPFLFKVMATVTLAGGTMFLMWLGEQITQRGIGNGVSLIIFSGIVANLPLAVVYILEQGRTGEYGALMILIQGFETTPCKAKK